MGYKKGIMFKPQSKYHSRKVEIGADTFDSKKEAARYQELRLLERAGKIKDLQRQVKYELIPSQKDAATGKVIERPVRYIADFVYTENGKTVVEDTKGFRTKDYVLKRKMMLWVHGIVIKEV